MRRLNAIAAGLLGAALLAAPASAAAAPDPAEPLFVVIYRPGPAWKPGLPMAQQDMRPHGAFYARLQAEGRVMAGGGFVGEDGGMAVLRAPDAEAARRLLAADPAVVSGVFAAELRRWSPRFGVDPLLVPPRPNATPGAATVN